MKIYSIALFIYILSLVLGLLNGIYTTASVPELGMESAIGHVEEITGVASSPVNFLWQSTVIVRLLGILINAFSGAIYIMPMLTKFGVSEDICLLLQAVVALVYIVGLVQWISGRYLKSAA